MKKQLILAGTGIILVASLFIFGRTISNKPVQKTAAAAGTTHNHQFDITQYINQAKQKLTAPQLVALDKLEASVKRGDVNNQQIAVNNQLAGFWRDSVRAFEPYIYYLSSAAKLENSEKNLTFAAQLILDNLRAEPDEAKLNWKSEQAISLFEQALQLNPDNTDLQIGLGSCYVYGKGHSGNAQETMKGIQQLLGVVRKDSTNMKAQLVLGAGGYFSGQYDKAIDRLNKVVKAQPQNVEAIEFMAMAYVGKGDKASAVKWYQVMRKLSDNPAFTDEIDQRIKMLR